MSKHIYTVKHVAPDNWAEVYPGGYFDSAIETFTTEAEARAYKAEHDDVIIIKRTEEVIG